MIDGGGPQLGLPSAELMLPARTIAYYVRMSRRARHIGLSIRPDTGLVVTMPVAASAPQLEAFLRRHQRWIVKHVDRLAELARRVPRRWPYGPSLPYRGDDHEVMLEPADASQVERDAAGGLRVRMRQPGIAGARRVLRRWFMAEAERIVPLRAAELAQQTGIVWRRIRVRDQRWRWGSCSAHGDLSFNFRLIMMPPAVLDYVIFHELMHRRQLNHSRAFWALVQEWCPEYRNHVAWLRTYGPYLGF